MGLELAGLIMMLRDGLPSRRVTYKQFRPPDFAFVFSKALRKYRSFTLVDNKYGVTIPKFVRFFTPLYFQVY